MKTNIISEFKGEINNVLFNDKNIFLSVEFLLQVLEDKFGNDFYKDEFLKDLQNSIYEAYMGYNSFVYDNFENYMFYIIDNAKTFEEIIFSYEGFIWKFEELNKKIKNGNYKK